MVFITILFIAHFCQICCHFSPSCPALDAKKDMTSFAWQAARNHIAVLSLSSLKWMREKTEYTHTNEKQTSKQINKIYIHIYVFFLTDQWPFSSSSPPQQQEMSLVLCRNSQNIFPGFSWDNVNRRPMFWLILSGGRNPKAGLLVGGEPPPLGCGDGMSQSQNIWPELGREIFHTTWYHVEVYKTMRSWPGAGHCLMIG